MTPTPDEHEATPEERIESASTEMREALIAELRDRIHSMPPTAFEDLVLDVLHAMGYGDGTEDSRIRTGGERRRRDRRGDPPRPARPRGHLRPGEALAGSVGRPVIQASWVPCKARVRREA